MGDFGLASEGQFRNVVEHLKIAIVFVAFCCGCSAKIIKFHTGNNISLHLFG
jgi:hypothetical protein